MITSNRIKELIKAITRKRARLSTLWQEKDIHTKCQGSDKYKPLYNFLVSDILREAHGILTAHPIMSTPNTLVFFLLYNSPTLYFLCMIEGFTLSIQTLDAIWELEKAATEIVQRTLISDKAMVDMLKGKLLGDKTSQHDIRLAVELLQALEVKLVKDEDSVDCSATNRPRKLIWNIFFRHSLPLT